VSDSVTQTSDIHSQNPNRGTDDAQDSDADEVTFTTHATTLTTGRYDETLDAAYYVSARLGSLASHDLNGNGIQDSGEPGIQNTAVTLSGTDGFGTAVSRSTSTDATGQYIFEGVAPGSYRIRFGTPAGGYAPTSADRGTDDTVDSDYGPMGMTPVLAVNSGDTILSLDAGYWLVARIGSLVWEDINGNGLQDTGEPGIPGVTVMLSGTKGDGDILNLSTATNAQGEYEFGAQIPGSSALAPGSYKLTFIPPAGGHVAT
jgi:hypothetical protein